MSAHTVHSSCISQIFIFFKRFIPLNHRLIGTAVIQLNNMIIRMLYMSSKLLTVKTKIIISTHFSKYFVPYSIFLKLDIVGRKSDNFIFLINAYFKAPNRQTKL